MDALVFVIATFSFFFVLVLAILFGVVLFPAAVALGEKLEDFVKAK